MAGETGDRAHPQLIPDIWKEILSYLTRDPPAVPFGLSVPGESYHQHDLTICMRLSSELYSITAPILYSNIYVYSLHELFFGLEIPPIRFIPGVTPYFFNRRRQSPHRLSKRELLKLVVKIHLLYRPDSSESSLRYLLSSSDWSWSGRTEEDRLNFGMEKAIEEIELSETLCETFDREILKNRVMFPKLRAMSIARVHDGLWDILERQLQKWCMEEDKGAVVKSLVKQLRGAQLVIGQIAQSPRVRHICSYTGYGPFSLPPKIFSDFPVPKANSNRSRSTLFLHMRRGFRLMPTTILGFRNIIYFSEESRKVHEAVTEDHLDWLAAVIRKNFGDMADAYEYDPTKTKRLTKKGLSGTTIAFHGATSVRAMDEEMPALERLKAEGRGNAERLDEVEKLISDAKAAIRRSEKPELDHLRQLFSSEEFTTRSEELQNIISFKSAVDTPSCPTCGFDPYHNA